MVRIRNHQQQVWCDKDFVNILHQVKAQRIVNGIQTKNYGDITKEMINSPSFKNLMDDLLRKKRINDINIKMDFKR